MRRPQLPQDNQYLQQPIQVNNKQSEFTEDEIQNLREIFELFDKEKTNQISINDLETIMGSLQRDPEEVKELIERIDPNNNGLISFNEFINLM